MSTGFPASDAQDDFNRARRRRLLAVLRSRLRRQPDDLELVLPFDEVLAALGPTGQRSLGLQSIGLDTIVGSVDRTREFDRAFRPASVRARHRWQRIAEAMRRGEPLPPIHVYRIGEAHFVRDGHHRVSVARALKLARIDAYVTEISTRVGIGVDLRLSDLPLKDHERLFLERVPLEGDAARSVRLTNPWDYAVLAEGVEAWGFRAIQSRRELLDRRQVAEAWYAEEYEPVVKTLVEAGLVDAGRETEADAYLRVAAERYRLMRTHDWNDEVIGRLRQARRRRSGPPDSRLSV